MFNVRIYCLIIVNNKLLALNEPFRGVLVNKFPGGGLEQGEGTIECLERELMEELNLKLVTAEHFYTLDEYVTTNTGNGQFLPIYYKVEVADISALKIIDKEIEKVIWFDIEKLKVSDFDLPVDKIVIEKLLKH